MTSMRLRLQKPHFFLFFLILLTSSIINIPTSYSSPTQIFISPNTTTVNIENNFPINITLINCPEFVGFDLRLAYDPSLLNVTSVTIDDYWTSNAYSVDEDTGTIYIYGYNLGQPVTGNFTLATVIFYAEKIGTTTLDLYDTHLYDRETTEIPHEALDGSAEIVGSLNLKAQTDSSAYYFLDKVSIYGNVTMGGMPLNNSLIAIEMISPNGPLMFRTTTTGAPPTNPAVEIVSVTPCDSQGNPKSSFYSNSKAYFNVTVESNLDVTVQALITVTTFDDTGAPFGYALHITPLYSGGPGWWIAEVFIPQNTPAGTSKVYACVFSDFPTSNGTALCPEKSATFQIFSGIDMALPDVSQTPTPPGTFNFSFRLGLYGGLGSYNISVTCVYRINSNSTQLSFPASLLGDFDGDGQVGIKDYYRFARSYGTSIGDPNYFPEADFNSDGVINLKDFYRFARNYGLSV